MAPKKDRKEAKEGREGKESNHNRKEEGNCAEIWCFLLITHIIQPFFIMKSLGKGCFGSFGTHYGYFHYFLWEK
jgi:hypothetical protein